MGDPIRLPLIVAIASLFGVTAALFAQQAPSQSPQALFRTGVDVVQLNVTVLDKERRVVRGLGVGDFTVSVDGEKQTVVAVSELDYPDAAGTPMWTRDVTPDVKTNDVVEPRLFVIVMDDALAPAEPYMVDTAKKVAREIVAQLGPSDLASVVFTWDNRHAQDFTADRVSLLAAIDQFTFGPPSNPLAGTYASDTVVRARDYLAGLPRCRTAVIYIGVGAALDSVRNPPRATWGSANVAAPAVSESEARGGEDPSAPLGQSQLAQVPIYSIGIAGLMAPSLKLGAVHQFTDGMARAGNDAMRTMSDTSGGLAIINTNDPVREVPKIFSETSSYYLVGFKATYSLAEAKYRRLHVSMTRTDLTVYPSDRMFASFRPPSTPEAVTTASALPSLTKSLAGVIPDPGTPLRVSVAPFAEPSQVGTAAVVVVLGVRPLHLLSSSGGPDVLDLQDVAFDGEGRRQILSRTETATIMPTAPRTAPSLDEEEDLQEFASLMSLKPGRYNLRFGMRSQTTGATGSVYADVVVPDFAKEPVSISGVVLSEPSRAAVMPLRVGAIVPMMPTTRRAFSTRDRVTAFWRLYQGGTQTLAPVTVTTRIVNHQDVVAFTATETVAPEQFMATTRAVNHLFALPLATLTPGEYLVTFEATLGKVIVRRDVSFSVR